MAKQDVTEEVKALLAVGFTIEYLNERLNVGIDTFDDGAHYEVYGRREEAEVENFARPYVEIRWTKHNHVWCLRGIDLVAGEVVEVSKRDGSTTTATVDEIIDMDGVFKIATIVAKPRRRAPIRKGCHYCGQPVDRWGSCYECGSPL